MAAKCLASPAKWLLWQHPTWSSISKFFRIKATLHFLSNSSITISIDSLQSFRSHHTSTVVFSFFIFTQFRAQCRTLTRIPRDSASRRLVRLTRQPWMLLELPRTRPRTLREQPRTRPTRRAAWQDSSGRTQSRRRQMLQGQRRPRQLKPGMVPAT